MYLPIFIALLMGLISPTSHTSNCGNGGTVYVNSSGGEEDPGTDPGDDGTGIGGPGPANPGGGSGQNPPPKP